MIDFLNLKIINQQYETELKRAAEEVIDSGWYLSGKFLNLFENKLAQYANIDYAVGVGNGLDALRLILRGYIELGYLNHGDEVIVPSNTYIATIMAISDNNLKPVLAEPDINTYNLNISLIEQLITSSTKAIMVVHLYGRICWSEELVNIAKKYDLIIIEDNAQAIGAEWNGQKSGGLGNAAGNSFYPGKNMGALGDAGAVTTHDAKLTKVVRALGNYGSHKKYLNKYQGFNSRMDEIQAAFLNVKLKYIDQENQYRREIAQYYCENITNPNIILPNQSFNCPIRQSLNHVWHLFVIRHPQRDRLQSHLKKHGIQTLIHYPVPPHKQKAYKQLNNLHYPIAEQIHEEILSLPLSPVMPTKDIDIIIEKINCFADY